MSSLRILQILQKYSDSEHPLTQADIAEHLRRDYGIELERKAIANTLTELAAGGVDICSKSRKGSFLNSRDFQDAELRLLIDAVLQSSYITAAQSKTLIERLCGLSSKYFRAHVKNVYAVNEWNKTENTDVFRNIDLVDSAIAQKVQIRYDYNKYGVDAKLHKTRTHRITPYQLILNNQRYYVMGYNAIWRSLVFHRLDHITNMKLSDVAAVPIESVKGYENGIDYKRISATMPYMYHDAPERIEFEADVAIVDQIVDWFGKEVRMTPVPGDDQRVCVSLMASPMAMEHWATQYVNYVVVTKPDHLRKRIKASLEAALKKY